MSAIFIVLMFTYMCVVIQIQITEASAEGQFIICVQTWSNGVSIQEGLLEEEVKVQV